MASVNDQVWLNSSDRFRALLGTIAITAEGPPLERGLRVDVQFHPDRVSSGRTVLEHLTASGRYSSQFETGTSNGGLTTRGRGDRWRWEHRMFGGAYDAAHAGQRPKYGALNHRGRAVGAAPRFGSSYLRLAEPVLDRTTFCFPDSAFEPAALSSAANFGLLSLADAFDTVERSDAMEARDGGLLDDYIEAHVHGPVDLASDVEAVVLDPCYRDTPIQEQAQGLGVPVEWHDGFQVTVDVVREHPDFRGARAVDVAERVADHGLLNARILGHAATRDEHDSHDLKKVWHYIARYGWHWQQGRAE